MLTVEWTNAIPPKTKAIPEQQQQYYYTVKLNEAWLAYMNDKRI